MARRLTIEDAQKVATKKKGKCLSSEYKNARTKLLWQCQNSHRWMATYDSISRGSWCLTCQGKFKWKYDDVRKLVESKGGILLSKDFKNVDTPISVKCENGHIFHPRILSIRRGGWCGRCKGKGRTIVDMVELAKQHDGKCLSRHFNGVYHPLDWRCKYGHEWRSKPVNVIQGHWCPVCGGSQRRTIADAMKMAETRNGKCLSKIYRNSSTPLKWQCHEGHTWLAAWDNVKSGSWCPTCSRRKPHTLREAQNLAKNRNGKCLSKMYFNVGTKMRWRCAVGHEFSASFEQVAGSDNRKPSWCEKCSRSGRSEEFVRRAFELLSGYSFPKVRPDWMRSPKGRRLELDGFCEKLGLAFEHQGRQHFAKVETFKSTDASLRRTKVHDSIKRKMCRKKRITLIEVPQLFQDISVSELIEMVTRELQKAGVPIKALRSPNDIFHGLGKNKMDDLRKIAEGHGGSCLSNFYVNARTKMKWKCSEGHVWEAEPYRIEKGVWCFKCARKAISERQRKYSIPQIQKMARKQKLNLISKKYLGVKYPLKWQCDHGHRFVRSFGPLLYKQLGCPLCLKAPRNRYAK